MMKIGFDKCSCEFGVYVRSKSVGNIIIVCLYVDDLLITGGNEGEIAELKKELMSEFEMTDMGVLSYFLGLEFKKTESDILMHQSKYATEILKRFNKVECNSVATPIEVGLVLEREGKEDKVDETEFKQIVGSLRYLCHSRPDLEFVVGLVSRYTKRPRIPHLLAAKRILRFIKGTINTGILFPNKDNNNSEELVGYTDAD